MKIYFLATLALLALSSRGASAAVSNRDAVAQKLAADYPSLETLYQDLHAHPELSLQEKRTSARIAVELRAVGYEVTENFGGYGVVGVLKNGPGPTLLLRTDMDALPVKEETGLPYASTVRTTDPAGQEVPVMHACGHDVHMTIFIGTARTLAAFKDRWSGTLVLVGQPAEERGLGARAMLTAGLYQKFPQPDFAVALHDNAELAAGTVSIAEGFMLANVDTMEIAVRGIGGHGAMPHLTKDPVVLAARIVLALQTIVSREIHPGNAAVITVGSIHGGTKSNIIPDEVRLQLTLRSYADDVRAQTIAAIRRICRGEAIAAGLPEELMPVVQLAEAEFTPATYNTPDLTRRVRGALIAGFDATRVTTAEPVMGGEDFGQYGRTAEKVPTCIFWLGAVAPEKIAASKRTGTPLPSLHSSKFAPLPEPTIKTGVTAFCAVAFDLLARPAAANLDNPPKIPPYATLVLVGELIDFR